MKQQEVTEAVRRIIANFDGEPDRDGLRKIRRLGFVRFPQ